MPSSARGFFPWPTNLSYRPLLTNSKTTFCVAILQEEFGMDICVMKSLGWADQTDDAVMTTDIASLPPAVAATVDLSVVADCAANLMNDAVQVRR